MNIRNSPSDQSVPSVLKCSKEKQGWDLRVVLADDHPIVLGGLRALLQPHPGVEIIAAVQDGGTALEAIRAHEPDVAVLDIKMPKLTGLDVLEAIEADGLSTRVILLTGSASDEQIVTAVERGAWGLLLKENAIGTLIECLEAVSSGQRWLPEELVAPAVRRATERRKNDGQLERVLTGREYEIAHLVAGGLSNKHICRQLNISEGTVKVHLHNVYQKLEIPNRTSLAMLAQTDQRLRIAYAA